MPNQVLIDAMINRIDELATSRGLIWQTSTSNPLFAAPPNDQFRKAELMTMFIKTAIFQLERQMGWREKILREEFYGFICDTEWRRWGSYVPIRREVGVQETRMVEDEITIQVNNMGIIDQDIEMEEGEWEEIKTPGEELLARMGPKMMVKGFKTGIKGRSKANKPEPMEIDRDLIPFKAERKKPRGGQRQKKKVQRMALQQQFQQGRGKMLSPVQRESGWKGRIGGGTVENGMKTKQRVRKNK